MPYLTKTLTSVIEQSLGHDRLEVIAVDDGSTDGTGEELERFASLHPDLLTVIHQENSGGPSKPRNVGLDHAVGRFVFFLDADDHLGCEALERMLAMAEKNKTDVVLGKMVGVNGRGAPASMFLHNQPRTDVFSSRVYWALNPLKLFRRELIERHGLRFPTGYKVGEDQEFTALAYLHADGISVVADYDCLYILRRDDGGNITTRTRGAETRIRALRNMVDLVEEHTEPGPRREVLMHRHLSIDLFHALIHLRQEKDQTLVRKQFDELRELVEQVGTETLLGRLGTVNRLRCELISRGLVDELIQFERFEASRSAQARPDLVVEGGRAFSRMPFFRDEARGIPDDFYDVTRELQMRHRLDSVELEDGRLTLTGHAYVRHLPMPWTGATLLLRERGSKEEFRFPMDAVATPGLGADEDGEEFAHDDAGFRVTLDLTTAHEGGMLPGGLWDVFVVIDHDGLSRELRFGNKRLPDIPGKPRTYVIEGDSGAFTCAALYYTHPYDNLTLDVGENKHRVSGKIRAGRIGIASDPDAVAISGTHSLVQLPRRRLTADLVDAKGRTVSVATAVVTDDVFEVSLLIDRLSAGTHSVHLRLCGEAPQGWDIPLTVRPTDKALRWTRFGIPWYAKLEQKDGKLCLRVERVSVTKAVNRRIKSRS